MKDFLDAVKAMSLLVFYGMYIVSPIVVALAAIKYLIIN